MSALGASFVCSGREHEVTGQRRLDRDLGRLEVADLADQDHVGRAAQHRLQDAREVDSPNARILTWTWLMPLMWYSTGSSAVMILTSGRLSS